jgi:hypothetical protein
MRPLTLAVGLLKKVPPHACPRCGVLRATSNADTVRSGVTLPTFVCIDLNPQGQDVEADAHAMKGLVPCGAARIDIFGIVSVKKRKAMKH